MKILLVQLPHEEAGESRPPNCFPLGLGYIATYLLDAGHEVEVFDIYAYQLSKEQVKSRIPKLNYDVVAISAMSTQYSYVKWLAAELKRVHPKKKIIVGGALAAFSSEIVLKHTKTDICVLGEGEHVIVELIDNLDSLKKVNGIYYINNKRVCKNKPCKPIKNLDSIPLPSWHLFDIEIYINSPIFQDDYGLRSMNIMTSRGCPYNCNYCSRQFKGVRLRSIDNVISEIKELKKRYGIQAIYFTEELTLITKERMKELCKKIKPLNLIWGCQGRVNIVDYEILSIMKDAGCTCVGYGIESGSQKVLNNMNKCATVKMAEKAIHETRRAGLRPGVQMIFGYPGETLDTIKETSEFCNRTHIHPEGGFSIITPLPGTQLYNYCLENGLIRDEEKFLEKLKSINNVLINFTSFSNEDIVRLKKETERELLKNYIKWRRANPTVLLKEYTNKVKRYLKYMQHHGVKETLKKTVKALKENPAFLFGAEYT